MKGTPIWIVLALVGVCGCHNEPDSVSAEQQEVAQRRAAEEAASRPIRFSHHILVDQFGYRPEDPKVAVIRNPQFGYDRLDPFIAGTKYEVRRADNGEVVFTGEPTIWNDGEIQKSSGDSGWWFDFSTLTTPGRYFIYDSDQRVRSANFRIDTNVYRDVLHAAMRMYYYQRSGFAKREPYAERCWTDDAAYLGRNQDTTARDITDPDNSDKRKDLSGGWFDAGDTNKYVTNAVEPVHQLLTAYQENTSAFTDDFNIPESGNGIPDVLDEIDWEIKWLKKMQYADGSAALKVGDTVYVTASPPSSDTSPRYYVPSCTSSTVAVAGMFAHAAFVFSKLPKLEDEARELRRRAISAWNNYQRIEPKQTDCDDGTIHAGDADLSLRDQEALAAEASIYLYATTADRSYETYLKQHYKDMLSYQNIGWSRYHANQSEALLFYTSLPDVDAKFRDTILADKRRDLDSATTIYGFDPKADLYRAYLDDAQYHWGSNKPRANYGNTNLDAVRYGVADRNTASLRLRALEILHYFHGVNPFAMVYLSNMYRYGATLSANEIYHTWFWHKTKWSDAKNSRCGPAPGFVPGGPNVNAERDGVPIYLAPPTGQPPQKSYRDWNVGTPEDSWVITEPGIYFQSAYVELLSAFVR